MGAFVQYNFIMHKTRASSTMSALLTVACIFLALFLMCSFTGCGGNDSAGNDNGNGDTDGNGDDGEPEDDNAVHTVKLPVTWQVTCYDESGTVIDCAGTGQDGDIQAGLEWPEPTTDNLTSLQWLSDANCIASRYASLDNDGVAGDGAVTWLHALDFVAGINEGTYPECGAGHTDWRLPNVLEIESLVNAEASNPGSWLAEYGFTNIWSDLYWSCTSSTSDKTCAWQMLFYYGGMAFNSKVNHPSAVLPVRNGISSQAFLPKTGKVTCHDESGTVIDCAGTGQDGDIQAATTDNLTSLQWLSDANCIASRYASLDNDGVAGDGAVTWQHALDFVAGINEGTYPECGAGHTDWRLPNRKELFSIVDFENLYFSLSEGDIFDNVKLGLYWTSTTHPRREVAWFVYMLTGILHPKEKELRYFCWPVRGDSAA
jgi:hypothetical protein